MKEYEINEDRFMFMFLTVTLVIMSIMTFSSKKALDFIYLLVVIYYFIKFLIIRIKL